MSAKNISFFDGSLKGSQKKKFLMAVPLRVGGSKGFAIKKK